MVTINVSFLSYLHYNFIKQIKLKKYILFLVLFSLGYTSYCQTDFQVKNLAVFCKYWGFLKYYHPAISKYNIDWDSVLVNDYTKVKTAKTKEEFRNILLSISQKLGGIATIEHPFIPSDSASINADFRWMEDTATLSSGICEYLKSVKRNHVSFKNKYIGTNFIGDTKLNESIYPEMIYPNEAYRFLALARYWNIIDYYFPDKYLMDSNWDISLEKAIPIFVSASNRDDYYHAMQWINARTDDSHAGFLTAPYKDSTYVPLPISTFYHHDTLTIIQVANDSIATLFNYQKGDAIISINGKSIKEIWQDVKEHESASNEGRAEYAYGKSSYMTISNKDSSTLVIIREKKEIKTKVKNYSVKELRAFWKNQTPVRFDLCYIRTDTISGKKYGYLNLTNVTNKKLNFFFRHMKNVDYLVIDIRNYPQYWILPKLAEKLFSGRKSVVMYSQPDYNYPGYLKYYRDNPYLKLGSNRKNYYKGKVIILVDHSTMSAAENEAMSLSYAPNATIIGTQTSGADGDVSTVIFPGNYSVWFTGLGWYYADGRQTQRIGIVSDIRVDYTVQTKLQGIDPIMQRTLEFIRTGR